MKVRETIWALILIAAAFGWVSPAFSQGGSDDSQQYDRLLSRVLQNPDGVSEELKQEVIALREAQELIRNAWVNEYRPAKGASVEEIRTARESFQTDYAEQIEESRGLRIRVLNQLREGAREAIDESVWSEDARTLYQEYRNTQSELERAWLAVKTELGEDATRREIAAARRRFFEANSDLIAKQKELALAVRQLIRDNRDESISEREPLPQELQDLKSEMDTLRYQLRERQRKAHDEMRGMDRSERENYRQNLLEEMKQLHDDIKERRRQVIDEVRDGQNGDRRPEG